ncbi:MAG: transposase [Phycisphaerae bacterium]|nr:transposase [Phycisphaerae bacterium]
MPRTARAAVGGLCYHVINRGNARMRVFDRDADYAAFVDLLARARQRVDARLLAFCLMPNHFHLVLWPRRDGDLGRYMQWLLTAHVRRYHSLRAGRTSGHVWQGRFKAFPIEQDAHLLTVMRYVERNARRAALVRRAEQWRWSSAWRGRPEHEAGLLHAGPVERPRDWLRRLNTPQTAAEEQAVRRSVVRGRPFGGEAWVLRMAKRLGLESTIRPRGRPRKKEK